MIGGAQEETDELLLFDEELMDVDPEFLPRRLLTDFTIYNAEARDRFGLVSRSPPLWVLAGWEGWAGSTGRGGEFGRWGPGWAGGQSRSAVAWVVHGVP